MSSGNLLFLMSLMSCLLVLSFLANVRQGDYYAFSSTAKSIKAVNSSVSTAILEDQLNQPSSGSFAATVKSIKGAIVVTINRVSNLNSTTYEYPPQGITMRHSVYWVITKEIEGMPTSPRNERPPIFSVRLQPVDDTVAVRLNTAPLTQQKPSVVIPPSGLIGSLGPFVELRIEKCSRVCPTVNIIPTANITTAKFMAARVNKLSENKNIVVLQLIPIKSLGSTAFKLVYLNSTSVITSSVNPVKNLSAGGNTSSSATTKDSKSTAGNNSLSAPVLQTQVNNAKVLRLEGPAVKANSAYINTTSVNTDIQLIKDSNLYTFTYRAPLSHYTDNLLIAQEMLSSLKIGGINFINSTLP